MNQYNLVRLRKNIMTPYGMISQGTYGRIKQMPDDVLYQIVVHSSYLLNKTSDHSYHVVVDIKAEDLELVCDYLGNPFKDGDKVVPWDSHCGHNYTIDQILEINMECYEPSNYRFYALSRPGNSSGNYIQTYSLLPINDGNFAVKMNGFASSIKSHDLSDDNILKGLGKSFKIKLGGM